MVADGLDQPAEGEIEPGAVGEAGQRIALRAFAGVLELAAGGFELERGVLELLLELAVGAAQCAVGGLEADDPVAQEHRIELRAGKFGAGPAQRHGMPLGGDGLSLISSSSVLRRLVMRAMARSMASLFS